MMRTKDDELGNNFSSLKRWGWVSFVYLALGTYFWSFSKYGLNIWDEGGYANGTLRTLNGEKALIDFNPNGYLPGRYWYGVLFFKLFGVELQSLRVGILLLTPPMIIMIYSIGRKIMPGGFALLAALFMLSAPSMYYNRFYTFFVVLNLYCLINVLEKKNLASTLGLFTAIFLSSFFKFEVALFSTLISLTTILLLFLSKESNLNFLNAPETRSPYLKNRFYLLAGGFLLFLILLAIYMRRDGYFIKVFKLVIDAHDVWGNPFPDIFPFFKIFKEVGYHEMFERALFYIPIVTYGLVTYLLLYQLFIKKVSFNKNHLLVISILLMGICAFGLVIWRAGLDNLLRTLPPFYILICYLLYLLRQKALFYSKPGNRKFSNIFILLPINLLTVFLPFLFYYEMNTHHGFYAGSIGAIKHETAHLSLAKGDVYTNPAEAKWIEQVLEKINSHTNTGDPILALPLNPIFYFFSERINPTPYEWILPGMLEEVEERQLIKTLKSKPPKIVVFVDIAIDGMEERRLSRYAPHLYNYLLENYSFNQMIGIFQILLPKKFIPQLDF